MSAPPPPQPSPNAPGTAAAFSASGRAAWDRRALRQQRRAASLAARSQRALQRQQLRTLQRKSLLGPVLLVALGLLLLLVEMGRLPQDAVLFWLSRWWPALLLAAGLLLLAEWALDTWVANGRQVALPRRTLGPGGVFLLILIALVGLSAAGVQRGTDWVRRSWDGDLADSWGLEQMFGTHRDLDRDLSAPLPANESLTIQNARGNITVTGSSTDGQVHVSMHQHLIAWRTSDRGNGDQGNAPRLETSGSGLRLEIPGSNRDRTDLTIQVPHESGLEIEPGTGAVAVTELRGPLTIAEHHGSVTLTGLTGPVHLTMHHKNASITGRSLSGDVVLDGRSGDLAFSDLTGSLTLQGDFFGTTHLSHVSGPVRFQSSFTTFSCAGLPGELTIDGRHEFEARNLQGPVLLSTTDRKIVLSGVRQGGSITDQNGSVSVTLANPLAPFTVNTTHSPIDIQVPEKAGFALEALTTDGQITSDLGLPVEQHGQDASLRGNVRGNGPELSLRTTHGEIAVHTRRLSDESSADPDAEPAGSQDLPRSSGTQAHVRSSRAMR